MWENNTKMGIKGMGLTMWTDPRGLEEAYGQARKGLVNIAM
jgi:hypothetical protein